MASAVHCELQRLGVLAQDTHSCAVSPQLSWKQQRFHLRTGLQAQVSHDAGVYTCKTVGIPCIALPQSSSSEPCPIHDEAFFVAALRVCTKAKDLGRGISLHNSIVKHGLLEKCSNALITMYAKCGALAEAKELLNTHRSRDVFSWTALIAGYTQEGRGQEALACFERMQHEDLSPDAATFSCVLKACGSLGNADKGKKVHEEVARQGLLGKNLVLSTALVDMYAKCGALLEAHLLLEELPFRTVVTWNALVAGYVQHGKGEEALACVEGMKGEGICPNEVTFICALKACGILRATQAGEQIHDEIARRGLLVNHTALGNALVDMYAKCGAVVKAEHVLRELPYRNVVSWSALINGYAQQGQSEQALDCFERMQSDGVSPNAITFASLLTACSSLGAIDKGKQIHDELNRQGLLVDNIVLGNALIDMYAKCGALAKAQQVLDELPFRDVVSWNALVAGYAQQGQGEQALSCFKRMQHEGLSPDVVTFSCLLNVCSHLGLVEDGHAIFTSMRSKYGVSPNLEICTCMIDLYGRAGHLEKAVGAIQEMSSADYPAVWHALLGACRKRGDVNLGRWAFEQALQADKSDVSAYVLMANLYAAAGMQEEAKEIEDLRVEHRSWKTPWQSEWINASGNVSVSSI